MEREKRYAKGYFVGVGIALVIPLGVPLGFAVGNFAPGPAMGLLIGVGLSYNSLEIRNPRCRFLSENFEAAPARY
jgi:hypothetical protein